MRLPFCVIDKKLTFATPRVLIRYRYFSHSHSPESWLAGCLGGRRRAAAAAATAAAAPPAVAAEPLSRPVRRPRAAGAGWLLLLLLASTTACTRGLGGSLHGSSAQAKHNARSLCHIAATAAGVRGSAG
jgi:hypothetical protein